MPEHAATQPTRVELLRERAFAAVGFISTVVVLGQTLWDPVVREVARLLGAKGGLWPFVFGSVFWPCLVLFLAAIIAKLARSHAGSMRRRAGLNGEFAAIERRAGDVALSSVAALPAGVVRVRGQIVACVPIVTPKGAMVAAFDEQNVDDPERWRRGGVLVLRDHTGAVLVDARSVRVRGGSEFDGAQFVSVGAWVELIATARDEHSEDREGGYRSTHGDQRVLGAIGDDGLWLSVLKGP